MRRDDRMGLAFALLVLAVVILSSMCSGCYLAHEAQDPDYHGCQEVDLAYEAGCPGQDLRGCPYMDRPCEWFHSSHFVEAFQGMTCEERAQLREDYCPPGATPLWPPAPEWSPCCAEAN